MKPKEHKENGKKLTPSSEDMSPPLAISKAGHKMAVMAIEDAKLAITTEGVKAFELYGNLLSDQARQPRE